MTFEISWKEKFRQLVQIIRDNSGEARFVGGCVRDSILGRKISDIDLATTLKPDRAMRILKANGMTVIPTGLKHGTFTTLVNSEPVEITTLRQDISCDGRHAKVSFTENWKEDAQRRDFTFNSLYMDIEGEIYDYFSGLEDLKHRRLKFVGEPEKRIKEDYLRILRVFRFQAYLCKTPLSEEVLHSCAKYRKQIRLLSGERIQGEMLKLLSYRDFLSTSFTMQEIKILQEILDAKVIFSLLNNERSQLMDDNIAALAALVRNTKTNYSAQWLYSRWHVSKKIYTSISALIKTRQIDCIKKTLADFGTDLTQKLAKILYVENKLTDTQYQDFISVTMNSEAPTFPVMGRDLIPLGHTGPKIGRILRQLEELWKDSSCTLTKEELLKMALENGELD